MSADAEAAHKRQPPAAKTLGASATQTAGSAAGFATPVHDAGDAGPAPWALLIGLTALAAVLRAIGLDGGLWYDEIRTLQDSVRQPLAHIVTVFPGNNQHTLYSVLAHVSIGVFGDRPWSLRLPALIFGVASVPALYLFARQFGGRSEALLACLLLVVAYHPVWFSQNARGYSAVAFFTLLTSWLLLRGLRRGKASDFVWYGVASGLAAYAHLTMVFLAVAHALSCVVLLGWPRFDASRRERWRLPMLGFAVAALTTLLLYAPLLLELQQFFLKQPSEIHAATPGWALRELLRGLERGATAAGALAGAALALAGLWSYFRQSRFLFALLVLPGVITIAAALAFWRIYPRFVFFLVGFGLLIVVRGALEVGAWLTLRLNPHAVPHPVTGAGVALVVLMAALSAAPLVENYRRPKQDFEGALHFVRTHREQGEPILVAGAPATYVYREFYGEPWDAIASREQLLKARAEGRRVWVVYTLPDFIASRSPELLRTLREECHVAGVFRGTVSGGDVTVCTLPAAGAMNEPARSPERSIA